MLCALFFFLFVCFRDSPCLSKGEDLDRWMTNEKKRSILKNPKKMCSIISSTVSTLERLAIPICLIQIIHLMVWFTRLDLPLWSHWMNSAVGPSNCLGNLSHILLWYKRFRTYEFGNRQNYIELINQTFLQTGIHTPPKSKRCGCAI